MSPVHRWILYHMMAQGQAVHLGPTGRPQLAALYHTVLPFVGRAGMPGSGYWRRVTDNQATTRVADLMLAVGHVEIRSP